MSFREDLRDVKKRREIIFYSISCAVIFSIMFLEGTIVNSYGFAYWIAAVLIAGYSFYIIDSVVIRKNIRQAFFIALFGIISVTPSLFIYLFFNW